MKQANIVNEKVDWERTARDPKKKKEIEVLAFEA